MKNKILNPISMFTAGLVLGAVSRLLDIYTKTWEIYFRKCRFGY
ncbi:hypothetical protein [Acetivibrio clariflavus]|nr:hypothetical protein [Acetivibrio clariflavus]HPT76952.1 hypothetical protein [Defluviitaleaceae bacterium]